jgi:hypothetical protein
MTIRPIEKLRGALRQIADPQPAFTGPECCRETFSDACELFSGIAQSALDGLGQEVSCRDERAAFTAGYLYGLDYAPSPEEIDSAWGLYLDEKRAGAFERENSDG